jgi:hypothetical protein
VIRFIWVPRRDVRDKAGREQQREAGTVIAETGPDCGDATILYEGSKQPF